MDQTGAHRFEYEDGMRALGYFTCNVKTLGGTAKTDFNFRADRPYDGDHWNQRKTGQPVFAHFNFRDPHKGTAFRPIVTEITEKKKIAWCGCKNSANKPFCDGTHRKI